MTNVETDSEGVKQALERLLAWPEIVRSPQLANFLSYIVDRKLRGDAQSIKAYSIAVDVFGRPANFDPQADPIVRVQARRLRGLLDQYYRGPGAEDPVQIQLPIGRYVPEFARPTSAPPSSTPEPEASIAGEPGKAAAPPRKKGQVTVSWFVLVVLALGATVLAYSLATLGPRTQQATDTAAVAGDVGALLRPRLQVMEFQNLTGDSTLTSAISALAIELVTGFDPFTNVAVSLGGRDGGQAQGAGANGFRLTGVVRRSAAAPDDFEISAILTDFASNSIVWNRTILAARDEFVGRGGIDAISRDLIMVLGGTRGPLHARAWDLLLRSPVTGQENLYLCTVLFSMYRTAPTTGSAERVNTCIGGLSEEEQELGIVLAAKASLTAEYGSIARVPPQEHADRQRQAEALLAQAARAAPTSPFVWEQRARLAEVQGLHDQAEADYGTSLQLNAAGIDATAAHARHLALIGRLEQALPLAELAIDAVPLAKRPDWFQCVPALGALRERAFDRALRLARACASGDIELGSVLAVLAAQGAGDGEAVAQQLPRVLEVSNFRNYGIMSYLQLRIPDPRLLATMQTGLSAAGVPAQSLAGAY